MTKSTKTAIFVAILVELFFCSAYAAGWYTFPTNNTQVWPCRQMITIDPSNVSGELTDFPVLVRITDSANPLFTRTQPDGRDIVFTSSDGTTKLSHEIEYYNNYYAKNQSLILDIEIILKTISLYFFRNKIVRL